MGSERLKKVSPYIVIMLGAFLLYVLTNQFGYTPKPGRIGPDFWPKAILVLAIATCVYEMVKILFFSEIGGKAGRRASARAKEGAEAQKSYNGLLLIGMAMTVVYVLLVGIIGFVFCTLLYLVAFMYLGRYRNLGVIGVSSTIGTLVLALIFLKFVYVSLPMGREPFSTATLFILKLLGIK